jgi:hypothetical protein
MTTSYYAKGFAQVNDADRQVLCSLRLHPSIKAEIEKLSHLESLRRGRRVTWSEVVREAIARVLRDGLRG